MFVCRVCSLLIVIVAAALEPVARRGRQKSAANACRRGRSSRRPECIGCLPAECPIQASRGSHTRWCGWKAARRLQMHSHCSSPRFPETAPSPDWPELPPRDPPKAAAVTFDQIDLASGSSRGARSEVETRIAPGRYSFDRHWSGSLRPLRCFLVRPTLAVRKARAAGKLQAREIEIGELEDPIEALYDRGFSDGLPLVPPTPERVEAMLGGRDAARSLGFVPPAHGEATLPTTVGIENSCARSSPTYSLTSGPSIGR